MILRKLALISLVTSLLFGCATTTSRPLTSQEVREGVVLKTGYVGCQQCYKVLTYVSPPVAVWNEYVSAGGQNGVVAGKAYLVRTNNTDKNEYIYRLDIEATVSGSFKPVNKVWLVDAERGFLNFGSQHGRPMEDSAFKTYCSRQTCVRKLSYRLPDDLVEAALRENIDLKVFMGLQQRVRDKDATDGYRPLNSGHYRYIGVITPIAAESMRGFVAGVHEAGGNLPRHHRP